MPIIRSWRLYLCCYRIWCAIAWLLVVGGQVQGSRLCIRDEGSCSSSFPHCRPPATKALHTICGNNTSIVSSSWWWAYKCPKQVEQIISAINHSVASSWFSSLCIYNDARTNIYQIDIIQFYYVWRLQIPSNLLKYSGNYVTYTGTGIKIGCV